MTIALLLAGCRGGGSNSAGQTVSDAIPVVPASHALHHDVRSAISHYTTSIVSGSPKPPPSKTPVSVKLNYLLPAVGTASSASRRPPSTRRAQAISPSNTQITIAVTPLGGSTTTSGPTACTVASCPVTFTAAPGPTTLAFSLSDGGGTVLSTFSTTIVVQPTANTTLSFTANPIVASVSLTLGSTSTNAGTPADIPVVVNALDADGNIIAGPGNYIDSNGKALTFSLALNNAQAGGHGTVTLRGPTRILSPGQAPVMAHYDGGWLDHSDIGIATNSSAVTILGGATLTTIPHITESSAGITPGAGVFGITAGPDGNLWIAEQNLPGIARMNMAGQAVQFTMGISGGSQPTYLATGPDRSMWFTEQGSYKIARISLDGSKVDEFGGLVGSEPYQIVLGPNQNLWFTDTLIGSTTIEEISSTGKITGHAIVPITPDGIAIGPDHNIWVTSAQTPMISRYDVLGKETDFPYTQLGGGNQYNDSLAIGSDGNLWFIDDDSQAILKLITGSSLIVPYTTGISPSPLIMNMVAGPDGNIWFTEHDTSLIGKITPAGVVTEYGPSNGLTAGCNPVGIVVGADGNIWFTEQNGDRIGKIVL